ncbi:hypothetical protein GCM10011297_09300 [Bacterioplanes sanyensis]|nr:hypothetical protein GCM10011297_09300 [Bacterioplanes sanyensis]
MRLPGQFEDSGMAVAIALEHKPWQWGQSAWQSWSLPQWSDIIEVSACCSILWQGAASSVFCTPLLRSAAGNGGIDQATSACALNASASKISSSNCMPVCLKWAQCKAQSPK